MLSLDEPPPRNGLKVRLRKRKYPPRACPVCDSLHTWYKSSHRIYCRQCKRYRALYTADCAGNAAWRALDATNGRYTEEWGDDATPFDDAARQELMLAIDVMDAIERSLRKQGIVK